MDRDTLQDIMKRRSGWRLFWPPWTLREDVEILTVAVLASLKDPEPPKPDLTPKVEELQVELDKSKERVDALVKWIVTTHKLKSLGEIEGTKDLLENPFFLDPRR